MPTAGYGECTSPIGCTPKMNCQPSLSCSCRSRNPSPKRSHSKPVRPADHVGRDDKTFFFYQIHSPKFTPFYTHTKNTHPHYRLSSLCTLKRYLIAALCLPLNYFRVPKTKAIQGHIEVDSKVSLSPRKTKTNAKSPNEKKTK